jgi:hypothetical protein
MGFFMGMIYPSVGTFEAENDTPIGPHRDGPGLLQIAFEGVEAIPGDVQDLRRSRGSENREDSFDCVQQVGTNPAAVVALIRPRCLKLLIIRIIS